MNSTTTIEQKQYNSGPIIEQQNGLTSVEAKQRLKEHGLNRIEKEKTQPWWLILLRQFNSPIVYLLLFAAAMSFFFKEWLVGAVVTSHYILHKTEGWNPALCNNILFFTLIVSQLLHVFNMNTTIKNFFKSEVVKNKFIWYATILCILIVVLIYEIPPVRNTLSINPLTILDWTIILTFSVAPYC